MTPEETEARLLAEWLTTPAGTPPPEGLSLEVVAAVYAMRPDRAPAPRVSIEDVLARVETGPFAPVATATAAERAPLGEARRPVGAERPAPRPAARPTRRAWWRSPLVGLGLTAALAAVIVIPAAGVWLGSGALDVAEEIARSEQAAPMASAPASAPAADAPARPNEVIAEAAPPEEAKPAAVSAIESAANADKTVRPTEGLLNEAATGAGAPVGGSGYGASAGGTSAGDEGLRDVDADAPAPPPAPSAGPGSAPATPAAEEAVAVPELSSTGGRAKADASADDEADGWGAGKEAKKSAAKDVAYNEAEAEERTVTSRRESSSSKAKSAPPPKKPAASADSAPAPTAGAPQAQSASVEAVDPRAAAVPGDYRASWYTSRADVAAVYAEAERLRAAGDVAGALAAYQGLITGSDAAAAQDAAWRAATLARQAGRSDALALVERGLGRSAANTAFRSNLLVLKGDLLRERGNSSGAAAAWAEAARLNAAR